MSQETKPQRARRALVWITAILLLAAFLRLYRLEQLPPGLHYDEAFKGVEARTMLDGGGLPLFFPENFGELPLRTYATALNFLLFGESTWSLRLVSAVAGILTVAALYALARNLLYSRTVALVSAFILAILYWHINFSRLGMEPVLTPLALTLAFAFIWRGLSDLSESRTRTISFALAGLSFGVSLYTYQAAFFIPVLLAAFGAIEFAVNRSFWRAHVRGLAVATVIAFLAVTPFALYFVAHPNQLLQRPSDVAISSASSVSFLDNAIKVAGMFFLRGDENLRSNLPLRPVLDPILAMGFIVGLGVCLLRLRRVESRLLLLWLGIMVAPSVLTEYAPHFGRTVGAIPAVALIAALGFGTLLKISAPRRALVMLLIVGLSASTFSSVQDYFNVWGRDPGLYDSFDVGYLGLAQKLRDRPANEAVYISPVPAKYYTVQMGLNRRAARSFDGRQVLVLPPPGTAAIYGIVTREDARSLSRLQTIFPQAMIADTLYDFNGRPYARLVRVDGAPQLAAFKPVHAQLGDTIQLIGYNTQREGATIVLTVEWGCVAEAPGSYTVFAHLIGPPNSATGSVVWAQDDSIPGDGSYPSNMWQAGEVVIDEYRLALPSGMPAADYEIEIGMYDLQTGARLAVTNVIAPVQDNRILLEHMPLP